MVAVAEVVEVVAAEEDTGALEEDDGGIRVDTR